MKQYRLFHIFYRSLCESVYLFTSCRRIADNHVFITIFYVIISFMTHFILLLYLISGFSGITSIIYLIMKYGNNSAYMKGYIQVHLSYTLLMLAALVVLYLRVNVIQSPRVMSFFIAVILIGQGCLCRALARFSFIITKTGLTKRLKIIWTVIPLSFGLLALIQILLWDTAFTLYPVILGVSAIVIISIWFTRRNSKTKEELPEKNNRIWIFFLIFTLVVVSIELGLKFYYGFLGEYSINIPLIFLCWNGLSVYQFKASTIKLLFIATISDEEAARWQLTEREKEISIAILRGDSNKVIASDMNISFSTVKNHIYNIYRKTGANSRVDLVNLFK